MFSGIIEHKAKILKKEDGIFQVENTFKDPLVLGQSIAHDGACMTLTKIENEYYEFFVMQESLSVTNLCDKKKGDFFNVERSLKLSDRIDGHLVTGHVDGVGIVVGKEYKEDGSCLLSISYPNEFFPYIVKKGSICVNGVSLTVVQVTDMQFSVSLIPLTQDWTNLSDVQINGSVNLEFDMIAKLVAKQAGNYLQKETK
ncbi:MAG: riboflavin synthase [Candidatus Altimarinota bacterium]